MRRSQTTRGRSVAVEDFSFASAVASLLVVVALASLAGCRGRGLLPPAGTMNEQQSRAVIHDPYPQGDVGPSDLGARPPGYEQPLPQPVRNRLIPDAMPWLGR